MKRPRLRGVAGGRRSDEELLRAHLSGDARAREELIERYLPIVERLARRYSYTSEPIDDLVQVGSMALLGALHRYRPGAGTSFRAYVVPTVIGELRRHFRDTGWVMHIPRSLQERALAVSRAVDELSGHLGRSPTVRELADWTGVSPEEVLEAIDVRQAYEPASLEAPVSESDGELALREERIGQDDERYETIEYAATIQRTLQALPERERVLIHLRFSQDLSQSEIAARLGCSQMHVSRLLRRALDRLRAVAEAA